MAVRTTLRTAICVRCQQLLQLINLSGGPIPSRAQLEAAHEPGFYVPVRVKSGTTSAPARKASR